MRGARQADTRRVAFTERDDIHEDGPSERGRHAGPPAKRHQVAGLIHEFESEVANDRRTSHYEHSHAAKRPWPMSSDSAWSPRG